MALILDVGQFGGLLEVTMDYSNAVLVAMLPYVSDVAKKLDLPLPQPITQQQVAGCGILPYVYKDGDWAGCGVRLKDGRVFGFHWGYLDRFETPHSYYGLQDPNDIPKFVGAVRMTKIEAVEMARDTLKKLGISLESVFAEQEPRITLPPKTRTGIVPHYRIEWLNPRVGTASQSGSASVDIEINADAKRVERLILDHNPSLRRPWPKIGVTPVIRSKGLSANPDYAWRLLPIVLRAVDDYGKTLDLPVPKPLTSNHVARFSVADNGGWPHSELELTNGWRFIYRNRMVNGYYAPDSFFSSDRRPIRIKDFVGKWNMTEAEAIALIRKTLTRLGYPTNLIRMDFAPKMSKPAVPGLPRYDFWWWCENETHDDLVAKVEAEVDADRRELKSLYFDHRALWGQGPPIDVPIAAPRSTVSNAPAQNLAERATVPRPPPPSKSVRVPR